MSDQKQKPPFLEKVGLRYFERRSNRLDRTEPEDEIHVLNARERKALLAVQRNAIFRQALAGAISAAIAVIFGYFSWPYPGKWEVQLSQAESLFYYGWLYGITFLVTGFEIAYLYYDSLKSVHQLSVIAGLDLSNEAGDNKFVRAALVRAALELPNPPNDVEGIDPRNEVTKFRVFMAALVYKLKATATNFILKGVLRRMVSQSAFRALMEFVAVPVYAFWNGLIAYWVLKQARIRAMGPSAVEEFARQLYKDADQYSSEAKKVALQAIGAAIVRTVDLHPNLVLFFLESQKLLGNPGRVPMDSSYQFKVNLHDLGEKGTDFALRVLVVATIIDGKLGRRERSLLREVFAANGKSTDLIQVQEFRKNFVRGEVLVENWMDSILPANKHSK